MEANCRVRLKGKYGPTIYIDMERKLLQVFGPDLQEVKYCFGAQCECHLK